MCLVKRNGMLPSLKTKIKSYFLLSCKRLKKDTFLLKMFCVKRSEERSISNLSLTPVTISSFLFVSQKRETVCSFDKHNAAVSIYFSPPLSVSRYGSNMPIFTSVLYQFLNLLHILIQKMTVILKTEMDML